MSTVTTSKIWYKLTCLLLILQSTACGQAQTSGQSTIKEYTLENYKIVPAEKSIYHLKMIGGLNWDGIRWEKDTMINYNNTTLYLFGDFLYFSETIPFPIDFTKARIISQSKEEAILTDSKKIYFFNRNLKEDAYPPIDIHDYERINDWVYKKDNRTFILSKENTLAQVNDTGIDISTLTHIEQNYFYDKNGLYSFREKENMMIAEPIVTNTGTPTKPQIFERYFIYRDKIYSTAWGDKLQLLELVPDLTKEYIVNAYEQNTFLTDGKNYYESQSNYGYDSADKNNFNYGNQALIHAQQSPLILQSDLRTSYLDKGQNEALIISKESPEGNGYTMEEDNFIAQIDGQYFRFFKFQERPKKLKNVWIYDEITKKNEILDPKQLRTFIIGPLLIYKNVLFYDGQVVYTEGWDLTKFRQIEHTNYFTDDVNLYYFGDRGGYSLKEVNGIEYVDFDEITIKNLKEIEKLKIISIDMLTNGTDLIYQNTVYKIKDMGIPVKIVL